MRKVNFNTLDNLTVPPRIIEKALAIPTSAPSKNRRPLIAAAIALILLTCAVIYGIFIVPASVIYLDSRESVAVTLNSRGNVLSAGRYPSLEGRSAQEAVAAITQEMLTGGALDKDENTLLITLPAGSDTFELIDRIHEVFRRNSFDGCIVAMPSGGVGRSALVRILNDHDPTLGMNDLRRLSVNDLALLLVNEEIHSKDIAVTGVPSESAYIGFDSAVAKAMRLTSFGEDSLGDITVSYGVYHGRLIYLVRLNADGKSEVYFINALSGATEEAIKAPSDEIDKAVENALKQPASTQPDPTVAAYTVPDSTQTPTAATDAAPYEVQPDATTSAAEPSAIVPTTASASPEYTSAAVSMMELSFKTLVPPDTADAVGYTTLFEGQAIDTKSDGSQNSGIVAVITDVSRWQAFLSEYDHDYTDKNGNSLANIPEDYFTDRFLIVSACDFSDASYYTTVTDLCRYDGKLYIENSLSYGDARSGEYCCRTLSIYAIERTSASPDLTLTVY